MAEDTHRGIGEVLRQAREDAGLQISDLAATTRISARYIEALEAEDWEVVPGAVIGRGFLRVLARELRQEPGPLLEAYREARGEADATPDHSLPESDWDVALRSERRRQPLLIGMGVVMLLGVGAWIWFPRPEAEVPPPLAASAETAAPAVPEETVVPVQPPADEPVATPPTPVPAAPIPETPVEAAAVPHRLSIQAVEKVWVRVEADGGKARDRLLEPGERAEFDGEQGMRVKLGNAGSVRLTWDGAALQVPGRVGEVKTLVFPAAAAALRP